MQLTDRIAELEAERDALAAKVDEAQNAAVTLSLKLGTAETRITELEAALREIAALKVGPGMIGPLFSAGMSAGFSAARLIAEHGLGAQFEQEARVRDLEAENARLNMEMQAYRANLTPQDAQAMRAVMDALYAEKHSQSDAGADQ